MDLISELSALGLLGSGLSQHARMVTLACAQDGGLPESLMVERMNGREAVNELFAFDIDALSVSTDLDFAAFLGEELTVGLLQPDGSYRHWHGLCTHAAWRGADGGVARYRLRLEPALSLLLHRRDSYIFQNKNAQDVVSELLADYPQVRFSFDISQPLESRAILTQYRERDVDFLIRVLAGEGLNWRFEHEQPGDDSSGDGQARHRVIFFDNAAKAPATAGGDSIRFHGVRATETDDAIDEFCARRQLQANAVSISSWDPEQVFAPAAEQQSHRDAGELPQLCIYDGSGERIASDVADPHSELMLKALELDNKTFEGAGAVRRLAPGHGFSLTQHERYNGEASRFKVLWVEHEARNNFGSQIKGAAVAIEAGTYRNTFGCVREAVALVPRATAAPHACTALGPQTAMIVGLPNAVSTTDRDHRVKVRFAWQRDADAEDSGGAWIRVAEALAGPNWGSQFTPRIGTEVLVDFVEGDMDRPLVVAQLYTGDDLPPFAAGVDSSANHAGALSGIHTRNFDGSGFNQWQFDDSTGQVRTRLATSTASTQLNLGYLIAQTPSTSQRGAYRGSGFELRTDAWGVVRGGDGVLLSTSPRTRLGSGVTSTQMDAKEAVAQLKGANELAETLAQAATAQRALSSKEAIDAGSRLIAQIDVKHNGTHAGVVNGQQVLKAAPGGRELDPSAPVDKFGAPVVLMDSPASVNWATPSSTVIYAGEELQWTSQSDLHLAANHTVSAVAANAAGLYSHSGGIQAIAGNGPVSLQAHTDQLEILADKAITVISVNGAVEINSKERIILQAGQSSITLEGGNITFACPGNFTVKGGAHPFSGGSANSATLARLPDSRLKLFDEAFVVKDADGQPVAGLPYRIALPDGSSQAGVTDELGRTHVVSGAEAEKLLLFVEQGLF